jgi:hypothetical protein
LVASHGILELHLVVRPIPSRILSRLDSPSASGPTLPMSEPVVGWSSRFLLGRLASGKNVIPYRVREAGFRSRVG